MGRLRLLRAVSNARFGKHAREGAERPVQFEVAPSVGGTTHAGFLRRDMAHVFHTVVTGGPGEPVEFFSHYPCEVCAAHGVTREAFATWVRLSGWREVPAARA